MPRIVDHDERRREICDVLLEVVADQGIAAVTLRGVAKHGGWSTGVISHYFSSRHALLLGGLRRAAEHLDAYNRRALDTLEGLSAIEHLVEGSMPLDGRRLALCRIFVFFYIEAMHEADLQAEVESYLKAWRASVAKAIRNCQASGDLSATIDAKQAATELIGLADGLSMHALLDPVVLDRIKESSPVRKWIQHLARASGSSPQLKPTAFPKQISVG